MAEIVVKCPTCGKAVPWLTSNEYRPFCSDRCKILDFGEWALGNRVISLDPYYSNAARVELDDDEDVS